MIETYDVPTLVRRTIALREVDNSLPLDFIEWVEDAVNDQDVLMLREVHDVARRLAHRMELLLESDDVSCCDQLEAISALQNRIRRTRRTFQKLGLDYLTQLPRAELLNTRFEQMVALKRRQLNEGQPSPFALITIDIDNFKSINDGEGLGHRVGDAVLQELASRIRSVFRTEDTIVRKGGDEFVVLLETPKSADGAFQAAQRCCQAISSTAITCDFLDEDPIDLSVTASIGVSIGTIEKTEETSQMLSRLLHQSDKAAYRAKRGGKNRAVLWSEEME